MFQVFMACGKDGAVWEKLRDLCLWLTYVRLRPITVP